MIISMIAALAENHVIGKDNTLPWHLPDDSSYFMKTTRGHFVILGRKNYDSLPERYKPLPNRTNVIITRQKNFTAPDCIIVDSMEKALQVAKEGGEQEVFIIGGAEIYAMGLAVAERLYMTEIEASVDGDTKFPAYNESDWQEISRVHHPVNERHVYAFDFVIYHRL